MSVDNTAADARRERFTTLAGGLVDPVRRYLARRIDAHTADDVLSEVLLVLWRRLDEVCDEEVRPWAFGVARLCLANAQRSAQRQRRVAAKVARLDPPDRLLESDPEPDLELNAALARLSERDREILRLWAWEELPPREIAQVLGMTPNAVSLRLHRAKASLAAILRQNREVGGHGVVEGSSP